MDDDEPKVTGKDSKMTRRQDKTTRKKQPPFNIVNQSELDWIDTGWMMKGDNARDNRGIEKRDIGQTSINESNNGHIRIKDIQEANLLRCGEDYEGGKNPQERRKVARIVTSIVQE